MYKFTTIKLYIYICGYIYEYTTIKLLFPGPAGVLLEGRIGCSRAPRWADATATRGQGVFV